MLHTDGDSRETCAILSTEPNDFVTEIHDRMPVILEPSEEERWLSGSVDEAADVLDPYPASDLTASPVSTRVNNPDYESPEVFEPVDIGEQSGLGDFGA